MPRTQREVFLRISVHENEENFHPLPKALWAVGITDCWFRELTPPGESILDHSDKELTSSRYCIPLISQAFLSDDESMEPGAPQRRQRLDPTC